MCGHAYSRRTLQHVIGFLEKGWERCWSRPAHGGQGLTAELHACPAKGTFG